MTAPAMMSKERLPWINVPRVQNLPYRLTYERLVFPEPGEWMLYYCGPSASRRVIVQGVEATEVWRDEDDTTTYPVYAMMVLVAFEIEPGLGIFRQFRRELIYEPEFREHLSLYYRIPFIQHNTEHDVRGRDIMSDALAQEISVRRYDQPFYLYSFEDGERYLRPCIV